MEEVADEKKQQNSKIYHKTKTIDGLKVEFKWDLSLDGARQPQGAVNDEGGDNLINN